MPRTAVPRRTAAHRGGAGRRRGSEHGQASIEFIGFVPILMALALAVVQLGLAVYTSVQAESAARAAARTASHDDPLIGYQQAGREAISDWLADEATFSRQDGYEEVTVTARVRIPSVIPGVGFGTAEKTSTMPQD